MFDELYITVFLVSVLAGYVVHNYLKNRRFWELMSAFKGDPTLPIIGNAHQFPSDTAGIYKKLEDLWLKHDRTTYKLILGFDVFVMLFDPENIEIILSSNKEIEKSNDYTFFAEWLGDGLLLSSGNKWRKQRKIITPTFHFKILEQFVSVFNNKSDVFIEKLAENKGKVFDIYPYVTLCTLDIICETAMGTNINSQNESESEYVKAVYSMSQLLTFRTFSMWKRISAIYRFSSSYREEQRLLKILHGTTNHVIQSRKLQLENRSNDDGNLSADEDSLGSRKKVAFLDLLLLSKTPEGESLSDEVIREEVDTFMFEGHDTTSSALSFALYLLANNPEQQKLAFDEQLEIFGDDLNREVTYTDLQNMKYLERVIKETLRLYPSVPMYGRKLEDDLTLADGKVIPKDAYVGIQHYLMNRNPKYYPDPLKFDPDRFIPENLKKSNPFAYVPFSAGPRNCIGQKFAMLELKSTISKVLRNYELISAGKKYEVVLVNEVILKSKNGVNLILKDRVYP